MRSRKRLQPLTASLDQVAAFSKSPMNMICRRMVSAPYCVHDVVGVDHVAAGLGHLLAALAQDHAVAGALGVGLLGGHHADVVQELVPEAGVQQVQGGVLHAAVVPVHRGPSSSGLRGRRGPCRCGGPYSAGSTRRNRPTGAWCRSRAWRGRRSGGRWCSPSRSSWQGGSRRRRSARSCPPAAARSGSCSSGSGHPAALGAVDQGDGLAPVALAGEDPVTQLVVDLFMADALLDQRTSSSRGWPPSRSCR